MFTALQRPFTVQVAEGTVICAPAWLVALLAMLLAGAGIERTLKALRES